MVGRRLFVTSAVATVVTAGISGIAPPTVSAGGGKKLRSTWWTKRLHREVQLQGDAWHVVELHAVHTNSNEVLHQFTLVFRGAVGDPIVEGTYKVKLGRSAIQLFVQPAGSDAAGTYSRATISRFS